MLIPAVRNRISGGEEVVKEDFRKVSTTGSSLLNWTGLQQRRSYFTRVWVFVGWRSGLSRASQVAPTCQCTRLRDTSLIPGLGRSPGRGHGNPLQYSCLENPKDRGAWRAKVWWSCKESEETEAPQYAVFPQLHIILWVPSWPHPCNCACGQKVPGCSRAVVLSLDCTSLPPRGLVAQSGLGGDTLESGVLVLWPAM